MNIAVDISPIVKKELAAHSVRGVGSYVSLLHNNLKIFAKEDTIQFITSEKEASDKTDLVHYPYFDLFNIQLPLLVEYNMAVTIHDLIPIKFAKHFPAGLRGSLFWNIERLLAKSLDVIITDSQNSKKDIQKYLGINQKNIHVVPLAADMRYKKLAHTEKKKEIFEKYKIPPKFFLYVGDATWNKNLPRIIEACEKTKLPLVLVGKVFGIKKVSNNHWNDNLRQVLQKIEENSHITAVGFIPEEDLNQLYNHAVGLVMPSLYEGFGLPVLEAMQSGCPVITSRTGSIPEVAGEAALFVDEQDSESIAEGMTKLLSSTLRKELVVKGMEQAQKFTIEKTIQKTLDAYHSMNL